MPHGREVRAGVGPAPPKPMVRIDFSPVDFSRPTARVEALCAPGAVPGATLQPRADTAPDGGRRADSGVH